MMRAAIRPLKFVWTGKAMIPAMANLAAAVYEEDAEYWLVPHDPISQRSRGHYHACLRTGWENLPERVAARFPSEAHLRKYLLIATGYRDERVIEVGSKRGAERVAAYIRGKDEFAVVKVQNTVVIEWTARSQDGRHMSRKEFQLSKDATLDALAQMIGVERSALEQNAGRAA